MNICHFMGRLTHDPQIQTVSKGDGSETSVLNITLALNRKFKKNNGALGKQVSYVDCALWDSAANLVNEHFRKGDNIIVHCSARNDNYTNSEGKKTSKIKFRVENFEFVGNNYKEESV